MEMLLKSQDFLDGDQMNPEWSSGWQRWTASTHQHPSEQTGIIVVRGSVVWLDEFLHEALSSTGPRGGLVKG